MKKHKRRKRYFRDYNKYQTYHRKKKLKVSSAMSHGTESMFFRQKSSSEHE